MNNIILFLVASNTSSSHAKCSVSLVIANHVGPTRGLCVGMHGLTARGATGQLIGSKLLYSRGNVPITSKHIKTV